MPYMLDGRQLRVGRPFKTSDGVSYSQLWSTQLTAEEKTAIGITYEADPAPFDSLYYTLNFASVSGRVAVCGGFARVVS